MMTTATSPFNSTVQPISRPVHDRLGPLARRFSHEDGAAGVLPADLTDLEVVTGFGPTNAPTAGTLSVMIGIIELQQRLGVPMTVIVSELGAWNSRNVAWADLLRVRDQMLSFLRAIGFDDNCGELRTHLHEGNLTRAGRIARYLTPADLAENCEDLNDLYDSHGLLGGEVGLTVDSLYTVADILGPAESGARNILMVSGVEEAYFTQLARIVLERQRTAGDLSLGWEADVGAVYFRVIGGLGGYPKMSKSIPASAIHLGMIADDLRAKILSDAPADQPALFSAIDLASGWDDTQVRQAHASFDARNIDPVPWARAKSDYLDTFVEYADQWKRCAR